MPNELPELQSTLVEQYILLRNFAVYGPLGGEIPNLRQKRIQDLCILAYRVLEFFETSAEGPLTTLQKNLVRFVQDIESIPTDKAYALSLDWAITRLEVVLFAILWEYTEDIRFRFLETMANYQMNLAAASYESYRRKYPTWSDGHLKRLT